MVTLTDGEYGHAAADALLARRKSGLYDAASYRARPGRIEGMPMFLYRERCAAHAALLEARPCQSPGTFGDLSRRAVVAELVDAQR